jgi:predicted RNase H-related nuclease YkuK (DUF458 family)
MEWYHFNGQKTDLPIDDTVESAILRELAAGNRLKICIGSDSQVKGDITEFATVIVFLRERTNKSMSIRERMITEVSYSVQLAYSLCPVLDRYDVGLEVHADINTDPCFKSNTALKDAMGYILGMGFVFKAKPEAFASSYCADRVVH